MRWFWLGLYKTSRVVSRVFFGIAHKAQWFGLKALDNAGGRGRGRNRKPLTAIWKAWRWVVNRIQP